MTPCEMILKGPQKSNTTSTETSHGRWRKIPHLVHFYKVRILRFSLPLLCARGKSVIDQVREAWQGSFLFLWVRHMSKRQAELHHRLSSNVRCCVVLHSSGPKGKWSGLLGSHCHSFHPTVLLEKALSTVSGPAGSGSGFRADLLRGRGGPIQPVIKHTAHLADLAPPSVPVARPWRPEIKHGAVVPLALCYQPGCLITSTRGAKQ